MEKKGEQKTIKQEEIKIFLLKNQINPEYAMLIEAWHEGCEGLFAG